MPRGPARAERDRAAALRTIAEIEEAIETAQARGDVAVIATLEENLAAARRRAGGANSKIEQAQAKKKI
jgi:hypothetical protein